MTDTLVTGGCACGSVRFNLRGTPLRAGLCHCLTCRKAHASAFNPFVVVRAADLEVTGELQDWRSSANYERRFCPICGSRVVGGALESGELEISLGSFDEPGVVQPHYESWVIRREPWLPALQVPQNPRHPP